MESIFVRLPALDFACVLEKVLVFVSSPRCYHYMGIRENRTQSAGQHEQRGSYS